MVEECWRIRILKKETNGDRVKVRVKKYRYSISDLGTSGRRTKGEKVEGHRGKVRKSKSDTSDKRLN